VAVASASGDGRSTRAGLGVQVLGLHRAVVRYARKEPQLALPHRPSTLRGALRFLTDDTLSNALTSISSSPTSKRMQIFSQGMLKKFKLWK